MSESDRKENVSEQSIHRLKVRVHRGRRDGLTAGRTRPSAREQQLDARVLDLAQALGEAHLDARIWKKFASLHFAGCVSNNPRNRCRWED